jgi:hypothetical protein
MNKVEVVLGGVKAIYDGGAYITLVDRLTEQPYDVINVWDADVNQPRIQLNERDVWEELDRAVHYEEHGRGNPKNYR